MIRVLQVLFKTSNSATKKQFTNVQAYVYQFKNLQIKTRQYQRQINQLRQNVERLEDIAKITLSDRIKRSILSILGIKYESKKVEQQKKKLKEYREKLQKTLEMSDQRWEKPRMQILEKRQSINQNFLQNILEVQQALQKLKKEHVHQQLIEAAQLNHRYLLNMMQKYRSFEIAPQVGAQFNQLQHQSIDQSKSSGQIKQMVQKGWKIHEKIVKKAKVRLN